MRRRDFITALGGVIALPLARAQQLAMPAIGFLSARSPAEAAPVLRAFAEGLSEFGYFEGKNVTFEYRWAEGRYDRLPDLARELVRRPVDVIAATGGDPSPLAAKGATATIPIVFTMGGDPVKAGLVESLNRPGANITGATLMGVELGPKRLELIRQIIPTATTISMLVNPNFPQTTSEVYEVETGAHALGLKTNVLSATTERDIENAFESTAQHKPDALIIGTDPFLLSRRDQLARLATGQMLPTMSHLRDFVVAGGLISYGPSIVAAYRQAGAYTGQILKGAKPTDLPILQPTKFDLAISLKTAKALGLTIAPTLLALADEIIE
jgi:putative tryptophan/tyrosine transport system substrate-binding protein